MFLLDWNREYTGWNVSFMMGGFYLFVACSAVLVVVSGIAPPPTPATDMQLVWKNPQGVFHRTGLEGAWELQTSSLLLLDVWSYFWLSSVSFFQLPCPPSLKTVCAVCHVRYFASRFSKHASTRLPKLHHHDHRCTYSHFGNDSWRKIAKKIPGCRIIGRHDSIRATREMLGMPAYMLNCARELSMSSRSSMPPVLILASSFKDFLHGS